MKLINSSRTFLLSTITSIAAIMFLTGCTHMITPPDTSQQVKSHQVTKQIAVTGQVTQAQLSELKARGFKTVIDLRPDGEGSDQPSSELMSATAKSNGLNFHYIPVKPGAISDESVNKLVEVLHNTSEPVLIYCKSGSRASRTWSLAEATKPNGMSSTDIMEAVKNAGKSADDLSQDIMDRIAKRKTTLGKNH